MSASDKNPSVSLPSDERERLLRYRDALREIALYHYEASFGHFAAKCADIARKALGKDMAWPTR